MKLETIIENNKRFAIFTHRMAKRLGCKYVPEFAADETDALIEWASDPMTQLMIQDAVFVLERKAGGDALRHQQATEAYTNLVCNKILQIAGMSEEGVAV